MSRPNDPLPQRFPAPFRRLGRSNGNRASVHSRDQQLETPPDIIQSYDRPLATWQGASPDRHEGASAFEHAFGYTPGRKQTAATERRLTAHDLDLERSVDDVGDRGDQIGIVRERRDERRPACLRGRDATRNQTGRRHE